ncbi:hypothetical protein Tco_0654884 [Tanacetum coccineum]|uniref:Transposase n=1 Tax=Tanacetum coccineum TaxID=301880 RepID=A0ABQ4X5E9_9ASTR
MSKHKWIYVAPSHTKKIFANMKREGKGFSGRITHLFQTMMVQAPEDMGEDSAAPTNSHSTPIVPQLSSSKPQKKKSRRKQRKESGPTEPIPDKDTNEEPISTPSCDPPQSGVDRFQLAELMTLCTKLQKQVLYLEEAKTAQAKEIASLKKRVKQLEKRRKSRTSGLKRLRKVGSAMGHGRGLRDVTTVLSCIYTRDSSGSPSMNNIYTCECSLICYIGVSRRTGLRNLSFMSYWYP